MPPLQHRDDRHGPAGLDDPAHTVAAPEVEHAADIAGVPQDRVDQGYGTPPRPHCERRLKAVG